MRNRPSLQAQMNVIPFIDIMLVLLIAFMITTPLMMPSLNIHLPHGHNKSHDLGPLKVSIDRHKHLSLTQPKHHAKKTTRPHLQALMAQYWKMHPKQSKKVLIEADASLPYREVMRLIESLKKMGATDIGLMTDPT